jgi:hypothetical protein
MHCSLYFKIRLTVLNTLNFISKNAIKSFFFYLVLLSGLIRKGKLSRYSHAVDKVERIHSSFLTSTLDGVSSQRHAPTALCPQERILVPTG